MTAADDHVVSASLSAAITQFPKAELHVHEYGALSPAALDTLIDRYDPDSPLRSVDGAFTPIPGGLESFFKTYLAISDLVRTAEDVHLMVSSCATQLRAQNVRYAELTIAPVLAARKGIHVADYSAAIEQARHDAQRDHGIQLQWVVSLPAQLGAHAADDTVGWVESGLFPSAVALGLGGSEALFPRRDFTAAFKRARALGLRSAPHAGEGSTASAVWEAIDDLHADRVGHAVAAASDPALLDALRERNISVECCITSNLSTGVIDTLHDHPVTTFADAGVPYTINTDDPTIFGTSLAREYELAVTLTGTGLTGAADLARASFARALGHADGVAGFLQEIDSITRDAADPTRTLTKEAPLA